MVGKRIVGLVVGGVVLVGACSADRQSQPAAPSAPVTTEVPSSTAPMTTEPETTPRKTTTTSVATTTTTSTTTTLAPTTTTTAATTTTVVETTTTAAPPPPAPAEPPAAPTCVVQVAPGDSLTLIAAGAGNETVSVASLQAENGILDPNVIDAGDVLDICPGNGVDDTTGEARVAPTTAAPVVALDVLGVPAQQQKLNELFAGYGLPALTVDGQSGRFTRQQLCAARAALGLPITRADMEPGGAEEQALLSAGGLAIPAGAPVSASRWVLIDQTCQIMFVGEGSSRLVHVFQTSTGEAGHRTRDQNGSRVFRFDPARANGGWHNSTAYPVAGDNPLNGNMYLPLYFDNGQAIHGANNVPPEPRSKGCARLRVDSQNALVDWLGLRDARGPIWDAGRIDLAVSVQGRY